MSWFKKAKINLQFLSYDSNWDLKVNVNGTPYTYYDVSPYWAKKLEWMIEKSNIPHGTILQRHLKQFSNPKRHKELNPDNIENKERQEMLSEIPSQKDLWGKNGLV